MLLLAKRGIESMLLPLIEFAVFWDEKTNTQTSKIQVVSAIGQDCSWQILYWITVWNIKFRHHVVFVHFYVFQVFPDLRGSSRHLFWSSFCVIVGLIFPITFGAWLLRRMTWVWKLQRMLGLQFGLRPGFNLGVLGFCTAFLSIPDVRGTMLVGSACACGTVFVLVIRLQAYCNRSRNAVLVKDSSRLSAIKYCVCARMNRNELCLISICFVEDDIGKATHVACLQSFVWFNTLSQTHQLAGARLNPASMTCPQRPIACATTRNALGTWNLLRIVSLRIVLPVVTRNY